MHFSKYLLLLLVIFSCGRAVEKVENNTPQIKTPVLVIHGGAGNITAEKLDVQGQELYKKALLAALDSGYALLEEGTPSLEVVAYVVSLLENDSLFNAGKGAVLNLKGEAELDASIMDGKFGDAGAVAGLQHVKNPILLAKLVMEKSPHVFLIGEGAEIFGFSMGLDSVGKEYFITQKNRLKYEEEKSPHGTVGAVAIDLNGDLAAATSTGGMWGKKYGRVGDVPVIGAGTFASNQSCGVSCTGWGEYFIRNTAASQVHYRMLYGKESLDSAVHHTLDQIKTQGGSGGIIAIDRLGNYSLHFNTTGMFRAVKNKEERKAEVF